ncbi:PaaX family transcriptional regulator C-terminal domain-containing protein [Microbacterium sp. SORGH_AS_0888]|uniref:PaaX family transcriptional regulator n=1 Tax=Microbacterium sp. SORGH_AS_0888 TaxID=3041791 RepID=UPI0027D79AC3|nr:PaaX family transcriptional regulator C-terminal domain-containing protein [Microbacterium sp. SORGH_AS_0888]
MSSLAIVQLAEAAGVAGPLARTALTRLKQKGILVPERRGRVAGYRLSEGAVRLLDEGDRRILQPRTMRLDDPWCVVSFSLPESRRALRSQLRRRLAQIGFGPVASALWIGPDFLRDEVRGVLAELDVQSQAVLFTTPRPIVEGSLADAVARWWDLAAIAHAHRAFAETVRPLLADEPDEEEAFRRFVTGVDAWRPLSFLDPGLPYELLPGNWPGRESAMLFHELKWRFAERAQRYADRVITG